MIRSDTLCRQCRTHLRLSQVQFATLLGVHPNTVYKWERHRAVPTPWQLGALNSLNAASVEVPDPAGEDLILTPRVLITKRGAFAAFSTLLKSA